MFYDPMLSALGAGGLQKAGAATIWRGQSSNITRQILKCTRWQLEETTDFITCPYHYSCDSSYPGDYSPSVGILAAALAAYCILSAAVFTVLDIAGSGGGSAAGRIRRKYMVPSGPFLLPLLLLVLAKGQRLNHVFPVAQLGPALLLTLQASALAFRNECATCLCRVEPLVVGGRTVLYRGLSKTALAVIFALCARMVSRIYGEERLSSWMCSALEGAGWVFVAGDTVYLTRWVLAEGAAAGVAVYGLVAVLVFLGVFGKVYRFLAWAETRQQVQWKPSLSCHNVV